MSSKTPTILVVDDIEANRETLRELLEDEDYCLVEAPDGPTALKLAAEVPPDLVLLDVMMPGMNGYEVCRRMRADARLAEVPIIMVTALDDQVSRIAGIEAGADDFVTKPFNRAELRARARTVTRLNRYRRLLETQVALRSSEERFRILFELGPVAIYSCDATGLIREFNQRAVELWMVRPSEINGNDRFCGSYKLHRPDGTVMAHDKCPMADVIAGRIPGAKDLEIIIERPDGSRINAIVNIVPLKDERGQITGAINCFHDITESKQAQEQAAIECPGRGAARERQRERQSPIPAAEPYHSRGGASPRHRREVRGTRRRACSPAPFLRPRRKRRAPAAAGPPYSP
jgi:PAS domain S-box-containing protein